MTLDLYPDTPKTMFAEIALPVPIRRTFTYLIPPELIEAAAVGCGVEVPFRNRQLVGYVVGIQDRPSADEQIDISKVKSIEKVLDTEPLVTDEILELTRWAADYYASFWGELLKSALPAGINTGRVSAKRQLAVRTLGEDLATDERPLSAAQLRILETIDANGGDILLSDLLALSGSSSSPVRTLQKRGSVEIYERSITRDPLAGSDIPDRDDHSLTSEQSKAVDTITAAMDGGEYRTFLLHGVTGSGKTEVYIRAMRSALAAGRSALMLVPEVGLTPVFAAKLRSVFGRDAAILHSRLSQGERFDEWVRIRCGNARVVIGTRLAVFAPLEDIGLIVIDEEHDQSYRAQESPFYNARDIAVKRASDAGAVAILGSATPSIESYYNASIGKYSLIEMSSRASGAQLAAAELIDMAQVFRQTGRDVVISPQLMDELSSAHARGDQSMVLLNRRGFSQFVFCRMCGESIKCVNCDITLTYHRTSNKLVCHYCNQERKQGVPDNCPQCGSEYLHFAGGGTEKIEDILKKRFPDLEIVRVDRDTIKRKGDIEAVLGRFARGEIDILVGTQMIAKGHDFPNVTLVGVIGIDIGLGLPDLRAAERTFQLVTQVAGRSGRGAKPGKVLIQTYHPDHYALRYGKSQDYRGFYREELKYRERFSYPPYYVLANISIKSRKQAAALRNAEIIRRSIDVFNDDRQARVLGPAQASLSRLKNEFRYQVILKARTRRGLRLLLDQALANAEKKGCDMRSIYVEIDPMNLM